MPPSINRAYKSIRKGYKSAFVASPELKRFKYEIELYKRKNKVETLKNTNQNFKLKIILCFPITRILTKKNEVKVLDEDNFLKAAKDAVSNILEFNDKLIINSEIEKVIGKSETISYFHAILTNENLKKEELFNI